jgi:hypothetical protein
MDFQIRNDQEQFLTAPSFLKNDYTYGLRKDNVDKFQVVFSESICPVGGEASNP